MNADSPRRRTELGGVVCADPKSTYSSHIYERTLMYLGLKPKYMYPCMKLRFMK
jgi:hypothetical protein